MKCPDNYNRTKVEKRVARRGVNGCTPSGYSQTQTHTLIVKHGPRPRLRPSGYKIYGPRLDPSGSRVSSYPTQTHVIKSIWVWLWLVEHERLHLICFNCKEFGLREGSCPRAATMEVQVEPESRPSLASVTNAALEAKRATWADKNSLSGPWILPKKPIRHKLGLQICCPWSNGQYVVMDEEISVLKKKLVDIPNPFEIDKVHGLTHEGLNQLSSSSPGEISVVGLTKKKSWTRMKTKQNHLPVDNEPTGGRSASMVPAVAAVELPSIQSSLLNPPRGDDLMEDENFLPFSQLLHLPRTTSNHYPILLKMDTKYTGKTRHQDFRILLSWFQHDGFGETSTWILAAYDLLLFGFASKKQAYIMEEVIKKFCRQSGQRVNVEKSQLTFSANVQPEIALGLSTSFGTSVSQSLGTYLAYLSFTNGDTKNSMKLHIVAWTKIWKPKDRGGFGLWKVFRTAYSSWRGLVEGYKFLKKGLSWEIGDGNFVHFWLEDCLVLEKFNLVHLSPLASNLDKPRWKLDSRGIFSSKSAHLLLQEPSSVSNPNLKAIWKFQGPLRFSFFLWKVWYCSLKTRVLLVSRGIGVSPFCLQFGDSLEHDFHVFRDCPDEAGV
ncbi:hypothetical protein M9H77_30999 [Catharanthus roseus]|uniref:Uncharacterized protein n=1 Tax=Catharanthus roseus TaxID=4058 RepID=A0ACC0A046_CATRO|nr:hypothetical protein M9H77_30999 [Catharanthus roseus]